MWIIPWTNLKGSRRACLVWSWGKKKPLIGRSAEREGDENSIVMEEKFHQIWNRKVRHYIGYCDRSAETPFPFIFGQSLQVGPIT